jgi:hypothetical protein
MRLGACRRGLPRARSSAYVFDTDNQAHTHTDRQTDRQTQSENARSVKGEKVDSR